MVDRGLISGLVENEPITESKLAPLESGAGLPPSIPPGMRAMSVKVDEVVGVAGFVVPGTRVDLVVTVKRRGDGVDEKPMSRTAISNVLVLTAGTRYDQEQGMKGEPQPATVVTLAVTPEDAERIALAASEGKISLALRNPLDVDADRNDRRADGCADDRPRWRGTATARARASGRASRDRGGAAGSCPRAQRQDLHRRDHPRCQAGGRNRPLR